MNSSILAEVPIFAGLKQSDLDQLTHCSTRRWFKRGSVIVTEGDPADGLYVVVSGRIKVLLSDNQIFGLMKADLIRVLPITA